MNVPEGVLAAMRKTNALFNVLHRPALARQIRSCTGRKDEGRGLRFFHAGASGRVLGSRSGRGMNRRHGGERMSARPCEPEHRGL